MPRFTRIRLRALNDLARHLRFSPGAAALRQVRAVIALAGEVDPAKAYPEEWVIRKITGYRADLADPAQLVGEALLADLSAFAERVSNQSRLTESEFGSPCLTLSALRTRWSVSARSIERYRRRGLIGLRLRRSSSRASLVFPLALVERFERGSSEALGSAARFARVGERARDGIIAASLEARSSLGPSVSRIAKAVAPRFGVSTDTVRRILRQHEAASGSSAFGGRAGREEPMRRVAFDAWRRAESLAVVARRLGVTRATVHREANAERSAMLRRLDLTTPRSPRFDRPGAADMILLHPFVREGLGGAGDTDAGSLAATARGGASPDARRERLLAEAHHFLCHRAAETIGSLPRAPSGTLLDRIETDLRWAGLLRVELVRAERGLIVRSIEERAGVPLLDLPPADIRRWIQSAFAAAGGAVQRFDPFKRGRLAVPVSLAMARSLASLKRVSRSSSARAHPASVALEDWAGRVAPWQSWLDPPGHLLARLRSDMQPPREVEILRLRFGITAGPPTRIEELRRVHGVSPAGLLRMVRAGAA